MTYLQWMGWYNLVGTLFLFAAISDVFAQRLLGRWTEIISELYDPGKYGRMWLFWAAMLNFFFGAINICAVQWELAAQRQIISLDIMVYGGFFLLSLWGLISRKYGLGVYVCLPLFALWMIWGIFVI